MNVFIPVWVSVICLSLSNHYVQWECIARVHTKHEANFLCRPTIWYAKHIVQFENMQSEQKRLQSVVWGGRSRVEGTSPLLSYWDLGSCGGESQGQSWGFWRSKQLSSALIPFTSRRRAHTLLFHTFGGFIFNLVSQPVCSRVMLLWLVSLCPCSLLTGGEVLMNIQRGRAVFSLQDARLGALSPPLPT